MRCASAEGPMTVALWRVLSSCSSGPRGVSRGARAGAAGGGSGRSPRGCVSGSAPGFRRRGRCGGACSESWSASTPSRAARGPRRPPARAASVRAARGCDMPPCRERAPRACPRTPSLRWPRRAKDSRSCPTARGTGEPRAWRASMCAAQSAGGPRGRARGARRAAAASSRRLLAARACSCTGERRAAARRPALRSTTASARLREGLTRGRASVPSLLRRRAALLRRRCACGRHGEKRGLAWPRRRLPSAPAALGRAGGVRRRVLHGRAGVEHPGACLLARLHAARLVSPPEKRWRAHARAHAARGRPPQAPVYAIAEVRFQRGPQAINSLANVRTQTPSL